MAINAIQLERGFLSGYWPPSLPASAWTLAEQFPSPDLLQLAFEIQHVIAGSDNELIAHTDALLSRCDNSLNTIRLQCRLAAAEHQAGHDDAAIARIEAHCPRLDPVQRHLARLCWQHPNPLMTHGLARLSAQTRFIAALSQLPALQMMLAWQLPESHTLTPLLRDSAAVQLGQRRTESGVIARLVDARLKQTVAVIGNAALDESDDDAAAAIDAADLIIRFNRVPNSLAWRQRLGRKTDLLVISPGLLGQLPQQAMAVPSIALSGATPFNRPGLAWRHLQHSSASALEQFPLSTWHRRVAELNAPPSAGILILGLLYEAGRLEDALLLGFSALQPGAPSPVDQNHASDADPASSRHNWAAEAALVQRWMRQGRRERSAAGG